MILKNTSTYHDFTGAGDTGVEMSKRGVLVRVIPLFDERSERGSVVSDTKSRTVPRNKTAESVDHNTAFTNVGNGNAREESTLWAWRLANRFVYDA